MRSGSSRKAPSYQNQNRVGPVIEWLVKGAGPGQDKDARRSVGLALTKMAMSRVPRC